MPISFVHFSSLIPNRLVLAGNHEQTISLGVLDLQNDRWQMPGYVCMYIISYRYIHVIVLNLYQFLSTFGCPWLLKKNICMGIRANMHGRALDPASHGRACLWKLGTRDHGSQRYNWYHFYNWSQPEIEELISAIFMLVDFFSDPFKNTVGDAGTISKWHWWH